MIGIRGVAAVAVDVQGVRGALAAVATPIVDSQVGLGPKVRCKKRSVRASLHRKAHYGRPRRPLRGLSAAFHSSQLAKLPRLPETAGEIRDLAAATHADAARDVMLGARANEKVVKTLDLTRYRVVAFATHGLVPGDLDSSGASRAI